MVILEAVLEPYGGKDGNVICPTKAATNRVLKWPPGIHGEFSLPQVILGISQSSNGISGSTQYPVWQVAFDDRDRLNEQQGTGGAMW